MARYLLLAEARDELEAGVAFYHSKHPELGREFTLEVRRLCLQIAERPEAGLEVRPKIRRRLVRRFPYSILYVMEEGAVLVIAVAHQSRRPGYWADRF